LPGGSSATQAYVDLPNGIISSLIDATFEAWYAIDASRNWARIFDFGSTQGPGGSGTPGIEITGPGGGGQGQDYIMYAPQRGTNIDAQRVELRNNDPLFGPGGSTGVAGAINAMDPEFNHTLDVQYHVALVFDADGGNDPGEAAMTLYINGQLPPGEAANPIETMIQLGNLNDVNNWIGRSNWTSDNNFDGLLNEFRIYDTALSAQQVAQNTIDGPNVVPEFEMVSLEVNTVTGSVQIENSIPTPVNIDYYSITSSGGALDPIGWNSLADQNIDAIGTNEGESWDEADTSSSLSLAELYLLGASGVSAASPLSLGHAFDVSVFEPGMDGDLLFQYAKHGSNDLATGEVAYITPDPLDGDYNSDGTVDAADYVVWRKTIGTMILDADGDGDGVVDSDDFLIWRWTFGNSAGSGAAVSRAAVPEPAPLLMLLLALYLPAAARIARNDDRCNAVSQLA
jgi:hypothetical protein